MLTSRRLGEGDGRREVVDQRLLDVDPAIANERSSERLRRSASILTRVAVPQGKGRTTLRAVGQHRREPGQTSRGRGPHQRGSTPGAGPSCPGSLGERRPQSGDPQAPGRWRCRASSGASRRATSAQRRVRGSARSDGRPLGLGGRVAPPGLTRETEPSDTTESCLSFVICWAFSGGYLSGEAVRSADRARARGQCAARVGQGLAAEARRTDAQR
jgi:hypothetical protein